MDNCPNIHQIRSKIAYLSFLISLFTALFSTSMASNFATDSATFYTDTLLSENALDLQVITFAEDSIDYDLKDKKVRLYKNAKVTYGDIELTAAFIELNQDENSVFATWLNDSLGNPYGKPEFKEKNKSFNSDVIRYNFNTKKGVIKNVITQEGEGYLLGEKVKKQTDKIIHTHRGRYTTCDEECPHFAIRARKIKTITGDKIITGPANLEIAGVPTPLFLPFGFFPSQDKKSSGIIFPIYGESANKGFFLRNGGYYFALNDYVDLAIKGDIFTKKSWKLTAQSNYKKRYRYNGSLSLSYASLKSGNEDLENFTDLRDFFINWKHSQDPKANPNSRFSANVNAGSSAYHQNNSFNSNDYLNNTYSSSISYNRNWTFSNLSANFRHSQNTLNNSVNLKLPEVNYSINRFHPLKALNKSSKSRWYDKIGISYTANAKNEISTLDSLLFTPKSLDNIRNGIKHTVPINASFKTLKHFTISPRVNYTERWYFNYIQKKWNGESIDTDTISGFKRAYNYNYSTSINTKIYGLVQFKKGLIKAIRHVITPSVSFNYTPDFSKSSFGFYESVVSDEAGNLQDYSIFQNGVYGSPSSGEQGNVRLSLSNILEMKVDNKKDTLNTIKKIKILESLNLSSAYNIFADSMNLSMISLNARTRVLNGFNINFRASYDPYKMNYNGQRINSMYINGSFKLGRLNSMNTTVSYQLNNNGNRSEENDINSNWNYINFDIPWSLSFNYSYDLRKTLLEPTITQSLGFSGDVKLTKKWKLGFRSGYDFDAKTLSHTSIDIYRDLHCWEMLFKWIPFGYHQSYNFTIRVKASTLQDLKWEKKKDWYDY